MFASCLMLSEKSPISIRYNHQKQVSECSYHIGVGFPYLHGYGCLAIPSDKQLRLGSHLLFVVWLQKEMIMKRFNKTPDFSFTYTSGGEHIGHYTENGYIEGNINQLRNKGIGLLITKEVLNNIPYYLCPIIQNDKIGFINSFADIIIEPQYDSFIGDFTSPESLITVSKDSKWGVLKANGLEMLMGVTRSKLDFD